jgi:tetratricopeptide (TPR) repeat protein
MSPEQFAGRPGAVDVRTDVYALGVMLYQLLAGRLPFRSLREKAEGTAAPMPAGCPRELRCIVAKAMSPEQSARYGSASALADDLRRFLRGERVLAHPPTLAYLMRAYARRQRGLAAGLVAAMVVAVAGTAAVWIYAVSEARARREADRERSVSESVVDHLVAGVIGAASPYARMGLDISVARALDHAAAHVEGRFSDPLVEASVRMAIGESYADLGRAVEAEAQLRRAADLRRSALGERDPRTIEATRRLASAIVAQPDRTAEARALYDRLYATARDALGPSDERTLHVGAGLAAALDYGGDSGAAATLLRELLDRAVAAHGEAHEVAQVIANDLATALAQTGALEEAERLLERTLEHGRRTLGDDHPDVILTQNNLAAVYGDAGRFDDAAALHRRTLESCRRIFGRDHPHTATSAGNLGAMLTQLRDFAAAEPLCREALEFWRGEAGPRARSTLIATLNLGQCLLELGRIEESLGLTAAAIPPAREVLPDGDLLLPVLLMLHANALTAGGNFAGAEAALAEAGPMLDALPGTPFVAAHREALEALGAARASAGPGSTAPPD